MRDTQCMTKGNQQQQQQQQPNTLAALRHATGKSSAEVAQHMGVGEQRIRAIEARFPNVNYETLTRYMSAIGGRVQLIVGRTRVNADQLIPDPTKAGTREYLKSRPGMGNLVYQPSAAAEELPLEQSETEPGSDDTGRGVDHPHPEGDQGDREDGEQP